MTNYVGTHRLVLPKRSYHSIASIDDLANSFLSVITIKTTVRSPAIFIREQIVAQESESSELPRDFCQFQWCLQKCAVKHVCCTRLIPRSFLSHIYF